MNQAEKELTEAAARAIQLDVHYNPKMHAYVPESRFYPRPFFRPLDDGADAIEIAMALRLHIKPDETHVMIAGPAGIMTSENYADHADDCARAARWAICRGAKLCCDRATEAKIF